MRRYVCRLKPSRLQAFREQWTHPQDPERWEAEVDAADAAGACHEAFAKFGAPIGPRDPASLANVDPLTPDWFECRVRVIPASIEPGTLWVRDGDYIGIAAEDGVGAEEPRWCVEASRELPDQDGELRARICLDDPDGYAWLKKAVGMWAQRQGYTWVKPEFRVTVSVERTKVGYRPQIEVCEEDRSLFERLVIPVTEGALFETPQEAIEAGEVAALAYLRERYGVEIAVQFVPPG